jgi:hypothetical protein
MRNEDREEPTLSPQEYEQEYIDHVGELVEQMDQYMMQQDHNRRMGVNYGPAEIRGLIATLQQSRQHLDSFEPARQWFLERNLKQFSNYLSFAMDELDKAIANHMQASRV